ncbi:hypothetical protein J3R82DRAFT_4083 [Butyriboletus roseoflavus]|nr:hypothetical protein J3R82DRAFT_4083 [Butyriboletus roseoflavus]
MTSVEADAEFKAAVQHLRKQDGARPREVRAAHVLFHNTPQGTLMVTSLAHFRSDYTIVHIPNGDFLAAQERLYSNINLLRMGCSGRSAVTLEEPSDTTKDRFKSTYFLSDGPPPTVAFRSKSHSRTHTRTYSQPVTTLSPAVPDAPTLPSSSSHPLDAVNLTHPNVSHTGAIATPAPSRHPHFTIYVLELVKLLQAALGICGMFPLPSPYTSAAAFDGLLCDVTIDGLRRWVAEIGESLVGSEACCLGTNHHQGPLSSSTRVPTCFIVVGTLTDHRESRQHTDPSSFNMFAQSGNSNTGLGSGNISSNASPVLPNQPFIPPITLSTINSCSLMSSPLIHPPSMHHPTTISNPASAVMPTPGTYLTLALHKLLLSQQDAKIRHSDSRKVHRVILSRLDPTTDSEATDEERRWLGGRVMGLVGRVGVSGSGGGPGSVGAPTADLGVFIREIVSGRERGRDKEREKDVERERDKEKLGKDGENLKERMDEKERVGGSLKALWSGKVEVLGRMRERAEGRGRGIDREREPDRSWERDKDKLTSSDVDDPVIKNLGDDELAFGGAWSGKVQKRLEMWTGINRSKKSVDLSSPVKFGGRTVVCCHSAVYAVVIVRTRIPNLRAPGSWSACCRVVTVSLCLVVHVFESFSIPKRSDDGDEDELLSSGQVSPASVTRTRNPFTLGASDVSSANLENVQRLGDSLGSQRRDYDSGVGEKGRQVSTWNEWEHVTGGRGEAWWKGRVPQENIAEKETRVVLRRTRRHTFHDIPSVQHIPVLRTDWMRIDVELCGQILMMRRREAHLEGVVKCLEYLTTTLAHASTALRNAHTAHKPMIDALTSHHPAGPVSPATTFPTGAISSTLPALPPSAFQTHTPPGLTPIVAALHALPVPPAVPALQYEAAQLRADDMWASTREARKKEMGPRGRRTVKVKGRRRWTSQWRLDGTECPVDALGRTESEAEEERVIVADGERSEGEDESESERESGVEKKGALGDGMEEGEREAMGPMWLLRVFMSWGARLGIVKSEADVGGPSVPVTRDPSPGTILGDGRVGAGGS